jgi:hypothetical protein
VSTPNNGEKVCVIGAGASGLVAVKNLVEHGFGVDCYERETGVGGAWNWRHDRSPVYASAHLISSKPSTEFPDFPMPDWWPDYPHHSQVLSYLERYADHFDLRRHIWFGTEVTGVRPVDGERGGWDVTTRSTGAGGAGRTYRYSAVVVANGHHWSPKLPSYEGMDGFGGEIIHARSFSDPAMLRGRRVLVVGAGNTGCDIAVEAAQRAVACWHSSRRGYWYVPKYLFGQPVDQVNERVLALRLPLRLRQWLLQRVLRLAVGDLTRFGLPKPDHRVYETHPIVNSQLTYHIGHGRVVPVPDVARFHPESVELVDGRRVDPDLVVLATGYLPRFDFLDPGLLGIDEAGRPHLALHAFGRHPTLAVAGLLQPDSGVLGLVHWQTVAIARWLRLREVDPERAAAMWRWLAGQVGGRWHDARTKDSTRHWFEVSHIRYLRALQRTLDQLEAVR